MILSLSNLANGKEMGLDPVAITAFLKFISESPLMFEIFIVLLSK